MFVLILLVFAFVCFTLAAFDAAASGRRVNLIALGLAAWVLTVLVPRF